MRTIYVDLGELDQSGALGLFSSKVRILPAGAVIRTEQAEIRAEVPRYQEMAERAGVFFFFEDEELPELPFFAVPGLELAARDYSPVVICESRGTQAEDALALRRMYQAAKNGEK